MAGRRNSPQARGTRATCHIFCAVAWLAGSTSAAAVPVVAPRPLDSIINSLGAEYVGDSSAVLVIGISSPQGTRVWGFGHLERDNEKTAPNGKTLFEIGSITKTMTGTLLAELVLRDQVRLDDPVADYFSEDWSIPRRDDREMSLLHLATHTSSLPRMPPNFDAVLSRPETHDDPYSQYRVADLKAALAKIELSRPIGSRMVYSNLGAGLLGQALARASGHGDPAEMFEEYLARPLRMEDTYFDLPRTLQARLAPPSNADGGNAHSWHFAALKSCGGLRSSANDMLRYGDAATGCIKTPLAPAFELALQPWRETSLDQFIGLGWFVREAALPHKKGETTTLAWHEGTTGGYRSFIGIFPDHDTTLVVLANTTKEVDPALAWPILETILRDF